MSDIVTVHSTFVLRRSYAKSPERVFAAFSDTAQKRRWYGESDKHETVEFTMDFRPGGLELSRSRFGASSPFPGVELTSHATFLDIANNARIVMASTMAMAGRRFSASLLTFEFLPTATGTDLVCTHQGAFFEGSDGSKMREDGWRQLFDRLARELES